MNIPQGIEYDEDYALLEMTNGIALWKVIFEGEMWFEIVDCHDTKNPIELRKTDSYTFACKWFQEYTAE